MVEGTLLALEHPAAVGESFNIGNARSAVTIHDLAQRIKRLTECPGEIVFQPLHYTDVELRIPNTEKASEPARLRGEGRARRRPRANDRVVPGASGRLRAEAEPIRLARPDVGEPELAAVAEVLASGQLTMGEKVGELERALASAVGTAHAAVVSSGTAALHLGVLALGVGPGDEVIVPAYTFPATANVVELSGARAVLVDVEPETFNVDPAKVAEAVTPRHEAVIAVHLFGRPVEWEGSRRRCHRRSRSSRTRPARWARRTGGRRAERSAPSHASRSTRGRS